MEILHTTNEEPFVSGTGHFAGWENRLMKGYSVNVSKK